jgi:carbonic anhydrase/acetyltransferase-like protein (isoleucine patch superfamily)/CBS domain-containing protein
MEIEQIEILEFLKRHLPFRELPADLLEQVALSIDIGYFKAGTEILKFNEPLHAFHLIRSGAVETFRRNGDLYNRLSAGGIFAEQGLLRGGKVRFPASALEDTLIYLIPDKVFQQLFDENEFFADYVEVGDSERRKTSKARAQASADLLGATVSTLLGRAPVSIGSNASVRDAAQLMTEQNVSALLILHLDNEAIPDGALAGIVTDKDMRARLIAPGLESDIPVTGIMSANPLTIDQHQYIFEAMTLMLRHNLHHLPVLRRGESVGIIAISDIIRFESQNSLFVVSSIFRQQTVAELQALVPDVHACFLRMVNEDANSQMIGSAMAAIGRSFKQRLLELAEAELGPAPVPQLIISPRAPQGPITMDIPVDPTLLNAGDHNGSTFYQHQRFNAVVRADTEPITLGEDVNVQDGCVLHADPGFPLVLERGVSLGHSAVVHGAYVAAGTLIGMGAVVLNGCSIGESSLIAGGAVLRPGTTVAGGSLVAGVPGKVRRELSDEERAGLSRTADNYSARTRRYRCELTRIDVP